MSQHDFDIANQGFAAFRADLNNALKALGSVSSGTEAPTTTYANQLWYETDTNTLHIRNEANSAWLDLMVIDQTTGSPSFTAGNVGIGTAAPAVKLEVLSGGTFDGAIHIGDTGSSRRLILEQTDATNYTIGGTGTSANTIFVSGGTAGIGTEAARIDASGNLLVGTTTAGGADGITLYGAGVGVSRRTGSVTHEFRRDSTDGAIVEFSKDGTTVGSIGTNGGGLYIGSSVGSDSFFGFESNIIKPAGADGGDRDNVIDLGKAASRFDDIFATNGTIQTSDRNEKQDIEELNDAERRVAVACKSLMRKYRWKDAVAEKGDEARIHFGIIAQDLQAAFAAEGLDAGRYAMFIHSTWTDEETGEEKSLMGVRYSELLAFMISVL